MMGVNLYEPGMEFLYSRGLSKSLSNSPEKLPSILENVFNQLKNNRVNGFVLGLYDPFQMGNLPLRNYTLKMGEMTTTVFRCSSVSRDTEKDENGKLIKACVGEQFKLFLDTYARLGKNHFYVNLMKRSLPDEDESARSDAIESLEKTHMGSVNVISLDRNSKFYQQTNEYSERHYDNIEIFKRSFEDHLFDGRFFYWSKDLSKEQWRSDVKQIIEEVHDTYFKCQKEVVVAERIAFIEIVYCLIIDQLIAKFEPDSCNFSCMNCIDRGGLTNSLMFFYYLTKTQGNIQPEQINQLIYLTFAPALLVSNRQIHKLYLDHLIIAIHRLLITTKSKQDFIINKSKIKDIIFNK